MTMLQKPEQTKKILIIDDAPQITSLYEKILTSDGFSVRTENDSSAALGIAREFFPDLILLDVVMPDKDGGDLAHDLKLCPATANTPIVFITGMLTKDESGGPTADIGGDFFIPKPVQPSFLRNFVRKKLAHISHRIS